MVNHITFFNTTGTVGELARIYEAVEKLGMKAGYDVDGNLNIYPLKENQLSFTYTNKSDEKRPLKVYIASPYTKGDVAVNVKVQMDTADKLISKGFIPYTPLLAHFLHMHHPRDWQDWLMLDEEWVRACDVLLRLKGESTGADREVSLADRLNIPVFYSIKELEQYAQDCDN